MAIAGIGNEQTPINPTQGGRIHNSPRQQERAGGVSSPSGDHGVHVSRLHEGLRYAQALNAERNMLAGSIRLSNKTIQKTNAYVEKMKAQIERIVKFFPPLPPGDPQRTEYIRNFAGIRKLISELTIPPDISAVADLSVYQARYPDQGTTEIGSDGINAESVMISRSYDAAQGLDIPDLGESASDEEIQAAMWDLDAARQTLAERRAGLAREAEAALQMIGGRNADVPPTDWVAERKSETARAALSAPMENGLTGIPADLAQLI